MALTPDERVLAWLLGTDGGVSAEDMRNAGIPTSAKGLLKRMFQAYTGDPVAPAQQLTLTAAAQGLTVPGLAVSAVVSVEVAGLRMRLDGTIADANTGLLLPVGSVFTITGHDTLIAASFAAATAGTIIDVNYWT